MKEGMEEALLLPETTGTATLHWPQGTCLLRDLSDF